MNGFNECRISETKEDELTILSRLYLISCGMVEVQASIVLVTIEEEKKNPYLRNKSIGFWNSMKVQMSKISLIDMLVIEYKKKFTKEEFKEMIAFYNSPIGKKVVKVDSELIPFISKNASVYKEKLKKTIQFNF